MRPLGATILYKPSLRKTNIVFTSSAKRCWLALSMRHTQQVKGHEICPTQVGKTLRRTSHQKFMSKDSNPEKYKSTLAEGNTSSHVQTDRSNNRTRRSSSSPPSGVTSRCRTQKRQRIRTMSGASWVITFTVSTMHLAVSCMSQTVQSRKRTTFELTAGSHRMKGYHSMYHFGLVHTPIPTPKAMKIVAAKRCG